MSNTFFVFLPSNVPDYPDNRPNKFRVHLPKPLYFSGNWVCGLHSINYPYSWPSTIGTLDDQWIDVHFTASEGNAKVLRIPVPPGSHKTIEELHSFLVSTLIQQRDAFDASPLERPEELVDRPTVRAPKKRSIDAEKNIKEKIRPVTDDIFIDNPDDYWEKIRELRVTFDEEQKKIDRFRGITNREPDESRKSEYIKTLAYLDSKQNLERARIEKLSVEARRRDLEKTPFYGDVIDEYFEIFPDNYNENLAEEHYKLIGHIIENEKKGESDPKFHKRKIEIEKMITRLRILQGEVIRRERQKSLDENREYNSVFVDEFFLNKSSAEYWPSIQNNFSSLLDLYQEINETKSAYNNSNDEEKKELQTKIDNLSKLAGYRRDRFIALEYEGIDRYKEEKIFWAPPLPTRNTLPQSLPQTKPIVQQKPLSPVLPQISLEESQSVTPPPTKEDIRPVTPALQPSPPLPPAQQPFPPLPPVQERLLSPPRKIFHS
uniref:Uncharacterized protein n=1 Tax=Meloidogyne enterolobii TaxID=390850 RepID=A0A6V7XD88_MELEN|nr:unnamed protein product [Meloidogyne enterolobii]